ncbi:MAG: hypothetical protein H6686_11365 [Fibrobacteria bacterium]|nr:hypothetical protein [Fibrobacteria bacterium]
MNKKLILILLLIWASNSLGLTEKSYAKPPEKMVKLEWGTFDSVITDYQYVMFWVKYTNLSLIDTFVVAENPSSYELRMQINDGRDSRRIGGCNGCSWPIPPNSSLFLICGIGLSDLPEFAKAKDAKIFLSAIPEDRRIISDSSKVYVRIKPPKNMRLFGLMDDVLTKSLFKVKQDSAYFRAKKTQCASFIKRMNEAVAKEGADYVLQSAIINFLRMGACSKNQPEFFGTGLVNWPENDSLGKCYSRISEKGNSECSLEEVNANKLVKRLAKLTKPIDLKAAPYKFLSGTDTVYVAWSSWVIEQTLEAFK